MVIIKLDGVRLEVNPPDLDGDGQSGGVEHITQRMPGNTQNIVQPTEQEGLLLTLHHRVLLLPFFVSDLICHLPSGFRFQFCHFLALSNSSFIITIF